MTFKNKASGALLTSTNKAVVDMLKNNEAYEIYKEPVEEKPKRKRTAKK